MTMKKYRNVVAALAVFVLSASVLLLCDDDDGTGGPTVPIIDATRGLRIDEKLEGDKSPTSESTTANNEGVEVVVDDPAINTADDIASNNLLEGSLVSTTITTADEHQNTNCYLAEICTKGCCRTSNVKDIEKLTCPNASASDEQEEDPLFDGITVAVMYYAKPTFLINQLETFMAYPKHLKEKMSIVIVDDGSPKGLRAEEFVLAEHVAESSLRIRVATILEDIPWNTPQARNLAFHLADTKDVFMTDVDEVLPVKTFEALLSTPTRDAAHGNAIAHQFNRIMQNGVEKKHPSVMFIEKKAFWEMGGFDEDLSGNYGHEDTLFWKAFGMSGGKANFHRDYFLIHVWVGYDHQDCEILPLETSRDACYLQQKKEIVKDSTVNHWIVSKKSRDHCLPSTYLRNAWRLVHFVHQSSAEEAESKLE